MPEVASGQEPPVEAADDSIEEIIVTLSITATLVVAVVFLFLLSWRAVLIPAALCVFTVLLAMRSMNKRLARG